MTDHAHLTDLVRSRRYLRPGRVEGHAIRWYVWAGDERVRRESSMLLSSYGHDAECECGWASRTGGGTLAYVERAVADHKRDALVEAARRSAEATS